MDTSQAPAQNDQELDARLRAVIVARQSSSRDERDPASQFRYAEEYAGRLGWTVADRHTEKSTSGGRSLDQRPGLLAALEDVRAGRADVVLVYHRDRLDRNLDVRREYVRLVEEVDGQVWSASDGRMSFATATDKLVQTQLGALDENYRDVIREKVAAQKAARIEAGCPVTAVPYLGYRNPGGWSPLVVIEEDRPHVVRAFEMAADGKSSHDIKLYLQDAGYAATHSMVNKMLRNEIYLGHLVWGSLRHDGAHEAIVSDRLFRRVQARRKPVGRKSESSRLLARLGVVRCGTCNGAMVGDHKLYRCSNRECDCRAAVSATKLEALVLKHVGRGLRGMRGHAGDVLGPVLAEQERATVALGKLREVARLADDLEGMATQIREAKERCQRADAAVADARSVAGVTWSLSSVFHGLPGDADFSEDPCFEGMPRETLRDVIQTMFESVTVARRENGVPLEDRVTVKPHKTFDVQPLLDATAEGWAEVLALREEAV